MIIFGLREGNICYKHVWAWWYRIVLALIVADIVSHWGKQAVSILSQEYRSDSWHWQIIRVTHHQRLRMILSPDPTRRSVSRTIGGDPFTRSNENDLSVWLLRVILSPDPMRWSVSLTIEGDPFTRSSEDDLSVWLMRVIDSLHLYQRWLYRYFVLMSHIYALYITWL